MTPVVGGLSLQDVLFVLAKNEAGSSSFAGGSLFRLCFHVPVGGDFI